MILPCHISDIIQEMSAPHTPYLTLHTSPEIILGLPAQCPTDWTHHGVAPCHVLLKGEERQLKRVFGDLA